MTINTVHRIIQERKLPSPPPSGAGLPPSKVYPAPDFPFKGWQPPQLDGYRQSAGTPTDSAIVIDNGMLSYTSASLAELTTHPRRVNPQGRLLIR